MASSVPLLVAWLVAFSSLAFLLVDWYRKSTLDKDDSSSAGSSSALSDPQPLQQYSSEIYRPLPSTHIRVLTLYGGVRNEELRGYLTMKWRGKVQDYDALSYVWGNSTCTKSMLLNNKKILITQDLYDALCHARYSVYERNLWIDALCINQANVKELNAQVSEMGDTYSRAASVINWLGLPTKHTALGLKFLEYLLGEQDMSVKPLWEMYHPTLIRAGLNDILKRDYFERIWVVQENALASKIILQIGYQTVTWLRGAGTYRAICRIKFACLSPSWEKCNLTDVDFRPLLEVLEQNMTVTRQMIGKSCREVTILDLAFDMRYRKATDRRDMLFALRNLVPEEVKQYLVVDYSKPVEELYNQFFQAVKRAYQEEIDFADSLEKEERQEAEEEDKRKGRGLMGGY
jgi:hypothetical protein